MTEQELRKLFSDKQRELIGSYPQKLTNLMFEVYEKGLNLGIEIGKRVSKEMGGWIKSSERLPEVDESCLIRERNCESYYLSRKVLVDLPGGLIEVASYSRNRKGECCWRTDESVYPVGFVLHWMELPARPKYLEEKEEAE